MKHKISCLLFIFFLFSEIIEAKKQITLEDIFKEHLFYPKIIKGLRSMQDGEHYTTLNQFFEIDKYNYETGEYIGTLFSVRDLTDPPFKFIDDYEFSSDETKLLLTTGKEDIYRYSFRANYYIYDLVTKKLSSLSDKGMQQLAAFSPDGNYVAYVRDNNIYIKNLETQGESQITDDGEKNKIINGATDWVYEEEFGFCEGFKWSPDSRRIAFYKFDEEHVRQYNMTIYQDLYPQWYKYKYPKAGETNSVVSIYIYDIVKDTLIKTDTGGETDIYLPLMKWTNNPGILSITRLNRLQNRMEVLHARADSSQSVIVYTETNKYYISELNNHSITYLNNGNEFLLVSEIKGWKHIYSYNYSEQTLSPVTSGFFDIGDIITVNENTREIFYTSHETSPIRKHLYKINIDGSKKKKLSSHEGWNEEAIFSKNNKYYILEHSDANKPLNYSVYSCDGKYIRTIEDNSELASLHKEYGFQKKEFFSFMTSYKTELNGFMIKPAGFNPKNKYPVFMYVYGGPASQIVTDRFSPQDSWFQLLAQMGYIVVGVDNRGTDKRGEEFRKSTYMQLGKLETEDQIETALYLSQQPYIDSTRIGLFGWSFGGYMSLLCLFKGADIFKMAIAVAPVTNWKFYDSVYTERFMRTPNENPAGYYDYSPINLVSKMKGKLLLIHGMADDNVHLQHSVELSEKLVQEGKQFDMQFYPNKNHGIYGGNTSYHLYSKMTEFVKENL